jgi:hypothetical protein
MRYGPFGLLATLLIFLLYYKNKFPVVDLSQRITGVQVKEKACRFEHVYN